MAVKPLIRKLLKITGITIGILLVVLVLAYVWFVHHAESIIREIVHLKSKGKVELSLKNVTYNFSDRRLDLKEAILYNTDSLTTKTAYRVSVKRLSLQLHALTPLILHRELVIDSILINNPDIRVMKSDTLQKKHGSLSHEIGNLYNSIHKALALFSVGHFQIDNGRFSLANSAREDWQPVTISNIYFRINNLKVDEDKKDGEGFYFSDDIIFNTHHQEITFPDGRYRMAFSNFRIDVKDRTITLDSCHIVSTGLQQKKVSVDLFFDKLRFANMDFPSLYTSNIIKADSMYAIDPLLHLKVTVDSVHQKDKPPVQMDTLLRHLGINTQLKYMGVKNISTSVVTTQSGQSAEFSTKGDDFEMRDLVIDRTAEQPVTVGRFDMAVRGYSSLNKDSTYRFKFDSIRIENSSILLNNFSINSLNHAAVVRHHQLPLFELDSLSWEELIFNRHIKAKQAVLYGPKIHYIKSTNTQKGKKTSIYSMLNSLDNSMSLERIRVINGNVSFEPNPDTRLLLQQVNLTVRSNRLLAARSSSMMGDAVDSLHFENGSIKTKKLLATIHRGSFKGDGSLLEAAEATVHDREGKMSIKVKGLRMSGLDFNDSNDHIDIGSATWKEAVVSLQTGHKAPAPANRSPLILNMQHIQGNNTHLSITGPQHTITTFVTTLRVDAVTKQLGAPAEGQEKKPTLEGVAIHGTYLQYTGKDMSLNTGAYNLVPMAPSHIDDIRFTRYTTHDSITAAIPQLRLVPDLEAMMAGDLRAEEITLKDPALIVKLAKTEEKEQQKKNSKPLPAIHVKQLSVEQPLLHLEQRQDEHTLQLTWNRGKQPDRNQWNFTNIRHDGKEPLDIGKISIAGTDVSFARHADKSIVLKPQSIQLILDNTAIATVKHHDVPWKTVIEKFAIRNMQVDGIGKDSGQLKLQALSLEHLTLQAGQHHREWLNNSPHFYLQDFSGELTTTKNYFHWKQLSYQHQQRTLTVDSFTYTPVQERDAYVAAHPYQTDYIQLSTGRISMHNPDLHGYFRDTLAHVATMHIENPLISVYRDKRPPREPNVVRPLPVDMLKNLQLKLKVDSILVHNGHVRYEELSEKTGRAGVIGISKLNASLVSLKSHDLHPTDSLRLYADAWLLDSIHVNLRLHESYTDSLAAFHMTTKIGPANLMVLNKVVEPLASVKIRSGHLDTLTLRAIGREYLSYGEMKMLYRKLNVQFLQAGDAQKRSFVTKMITFIANTFVIKTRNEHKTGIIYFERLRDRSIFNYMIKMVMSGAGSSVGAKKNKKYIKHYKRELRKQGLPPIHL
ncbi:MAG: hypothetical protein J7621_02235 [Niastella sp.]|nr:hypothetical protein [Niastella sp.]